MANQYLLLRDWVAFQYFALPEILKLPNPTDGSGFHITKTVKATLVLIPLFGAHFLLILYRPQPGGDCIWTKIHFYAHYLVDGLQGSLVATIYCYMNSEVQDKVKRTYNRIIDRYEIRRHKSVKTRALSYTTNYTTVVDSVQGTSCKKEKNDNDNENENENEEKIADMESRL
ncbi:Calcitonin gene-related peptide type 1 receptor [Nymphon striatum]|nr:Calcitonin gene-related peptide type 1 receptor [Nymphon striatum]